MQQSKITGLALMAMLAITALTATTASAAEPEFSSFPNAFTSKGGPAKFEQTEGIGAISCTKSEGTGAVTAAKKGTFDLLFLGCTAPLSGKCTGLADTVKGSILAKGTFDLRYISKTAKDVGILFLIKPVHLECEKTVELIEVRGCVVGLVRPINTRTKTVTVGLTQKGGRNEFTQVLNEANSGTEGCKLESEFNGAAFKQSGLENTNEQTSETAAEIKA
jgi:hypothetical protein